MQKYVLIVAGGGGSRFGNSTPKQFAELKGKPVLMHTFEAFSIFNDISFVLVLPKNLFQEWDKLCTEHNFTTRYQIAESGPKRFHSVKSGLKFVPDDCLVAIHDGVRPLVSKNTIEKSFNLAQRKGSGIPVIQIHESVRQTDGVLSEPIEREILRIVQTPQVFQSSLIKRAYRQNFDEKFTDDAMVFESDGNQIFLTEGNKENIKITETIDLEIAEKLHSLKREKI